MKVVLGIDAAWTSEKPSGVALAVSAGSSWTLLAAAPSYERFCGIAEGGSAQAGRPTGSVPDMQALLDAAWTLAKAPVDLITADIPLSRTAITGRRAADNAVSKAYGGRHCATHSPSSTRPGAISTTILRGSAAAGYPLLTTEMKTPGLAEVYPHPALLELMLRDRRLPYKESKRRAYWPKLAPQERTGLLLNEWGKIVAAMGAEINRVHVLLKLPEAQAPGWVLKAFEDALDAAVCVWVGIRMLEGRAQPHGDTNAAIWIPEGRRHEEEYLRPRASIGS